MSWVQFVILIIFLGMLAGSVNHVATAIRIAGTCG